MNKLKHFSISQLSRFSGIKSHTIRIWEQRYDALRPERTQGNTRYYDSDQLRRLLNIVGLTNVGYKISELAAMSDEMLFSLVLQTEKNKNTEDQTEFFTSRLIEAGIGFNEAYFDKLLSHCMLRYGMKRTYLDIVYPLLKRVGLMWSVGQIPPAHEHFISNIVRRKIYTAIDGLPVADKRERWLLFLPENELHEIGLLWSYFMIRSTGREVVYLGSDVPYSSLLEAIRLTSPSALLFFMVHNNTSKEVQVFLDKLTRDCERQEIFLSGTPDLIKQLKLKDNIHWLTSMTDLEKVMVSV